MRVPVLLFFVSSILWLLLSSAFGALAALKLNVPGFLSEFGWLTIGRRATRRRPSSLAYGWAASAGIGAALWIWRGCGRAPAPRRPDVAAWLLWNLGVTPGRVGDPVRPRHVVRRAGVPALRVARCCSRRSCSSRVWALLMFRYRQRGRDCTFPSGTRWRRSCGSRGCYATANLLVFFLPVQAPAQGDRRARGTRRACSRRSSCRWRWRLRITSCPR